MSAKEEILARIRTALADAPAPVPVTRDYRVATGSRGDVDLFAERVADYRAAVHRCDTDAAAVSGRIANVLAARGVAPVLAPDGVPDEWLAGVPAIRDTGLSTVELDAVGGVLTSCALAIADTGTIVLDHGPGQGRRALTLVPDYHLVVVRTDQIVATVPDTVAVLDPRKPLTWISGPSATSDIELSRVEGVHGPRTLDVVIVGGGYARTHAT